MKKYYLFLFVGIVCTIQAFTQDLSVEKIWKKYEFSGAYIDGFRSMKDGIHYTKLDEKDGKVSITKHLISDANASSETLVTSDQLKYNGNLISIDDYFFNDDETKILITTQTTPIYRRSFNAVYYLFDLKHTNHKL